MVVAVTLALAFLLHRLLPYANLSLLFLTAVLIVAARNGLGPSLLASVLSFLAYNYFFTRPYYTLTVDDSGDVATLAFFLIVAAITGNLAARMQREMRKRRASLVSMSDLFEFSRLMSSAARAETIAEELVGHLQRTLGRPAWVLLPETGGCPAARFSAGAPEALSDRLADTLQQRFWPGTEYVGDDRGPAGDGWTLFTLTGGRDNRGLAAIQGGLDADEVDWARSLCEQAGVALDRTRLVADLDETRLVYETEQLRSALLSSVSHDLRTPLASIIGSTTSLLEYGDSISPDDRRELLTMVVDESRRLDRHIQNLLDMTRIGQGGLQLHRDWVDVHDLVSSALDRLQNAIKDVRMVVDVPGAIPLLKVHGLLLESALVNLLDNAIRFSPPEGEVSVAARSDGESLEIDVCDQGPGIPEAERELVFDMFYTARHGDRGDRQGTGLGLTICRGMVAAHGGTVVAMAGPGGRGTCMRVSLPLAMNGGSDTR